MKTKEELLKLKNECKAFADKLNGLTEDELDEISGGGFKEKAESIFRHAKDIHQVTKPVVKVIADPVVSPAVLKEDK